MKNLSLNLKYCFGIGELKHKFCFLEKQTNSFLIYAPNGTMKTSLAKTFDLIAKNDQKDMPRDKVYSNRVPKYEVLVDENQILPESILVINAETDSFDASSKVSSFVASKELKSKYDSIYQELDSRRIEFIKKLKLVSKSTDCESEFVETFLGNDQENFFDAIVKAFEFGGQELNEYNFRYNDVFDRKQNVKKFLDKNVAALDQYLSNYTELIENSKFFKNIAGNSFGTHQASELLKSIEDNSFFDAGHRFLLEDGTLISDAKELQDVVRAEVEAIVNDKKLKAAFDKVDKSLSTNVELRAFKKVIEKNNLLLIDLKNYDEFKRKIWIGFLTELELDTKSLIEFYQSQKADLEEIVNEAKSESALWKQIIDTFNARFHVPFKVVMTNHDDVILKRKTANLEFHYRDSREDPDVKKGKQELLEVLSRGEKRAYFILQFLFEIESRRRSDLPQLLIFDDVADSFDYKNKFAIIEYINELHLSNKFRLLILTHNFDFYRTIASRANLFKYSFIAVKDSFKVVKLKPGNYMNDVFKSYVKNINDPKVFLSMLAFVRNIIEYTDSNKCSDYNLLTSCLHEKVGSREILVKQVFEIYQRRFDKLKDVKIAFDQNDRIQECIFAVAIEIVNDVEIDEVNLENKIILAIASRLKVEQYILSKLPAIDRDLLAYNQTRILSQNYVEAFPESTNREVISKVNLMTPENIHLNSFMYEPLIDLSVHQLVETCKRAMELI